MIAATYNYYYVPTPTPNLPDLNDCHNPKMWAKWFREFLFEKIPAKVATLILSIGFYPPVSRRARFPHAFDWRSKMKRWKQAL